MINRDITKEVIEAARHFSAVALVGPRQSGKTTLVQTIFNQHAYVSLEDFDQRALALADPRGFLEQHSNDHGIILDEIQHAHQLLSYIQTIIDREKKRGFFIITGSQNILVNEAITQTLAGRIAILTLFPLSIHELLQTKSHDLSLQEVIFNGMYPRVYADSLSPEKLYANYIRGYIERDVRQLKNILNLDLFQTFLQLCAGRIGQVVNISSLANDCGIDQKTANSWLALLEATYVIFLLQPYYKNLGKRLVKAPKLYFVDTGIAASLLLIRSPQELVNHYLWGGLVESFIISDLYKQFYNLDRRPALYFWRDHVGNEVDCLVETALDVAAIEIKAGKTVSGDYFKPFHYLKTVRSLPPYKSFVIYGGADNQNWPEARLLSWRNAGTLIDSL